MRLAPWIRLIRIAAFIAGSIVVLTLLSLPQARVWLPWEAIIGYFTIALAVSTTLLWWETRRLAQAGLDQAGDLRRSVEAAEMAAAAAFKQAKVAELALIGVERPVLRLDLLDWGPALPIRLTKQEEVLQPWLISKLENYGKITATISNIEYEIRAYENLGPDSTPFPIPGETKFEFLSSYALEYTHILPPGHAIELKLGGFVKLSEELLRAMWGIGSRRLVLFGVIDYEDSIGLRRKKGFTYAYFPLSTENKKNGDWLVVDWEGRQFDRIVGGIGLDAPLGSQFEFFP